MSDRMLGEGCGRCPGSSYGNRRFVEPPLARTEHVLVACAKAERDGHIVPRLAAAGLTFEAAEAAVKRAVPPNAEREVPWGGVVHTPRLQKIMGIAEGWCLAGTWPGPATVDLPRLVFALLYEGEGVAAQVAVQAGLDLPAVV